MHHLQLCITGVEHMGLYEHVGISNWTHSMHHLQLCITGVEHMGLHEHIGISNWTHSMHHLQLCITGVEHTGLYEHVGISNWTHSMHHLQLCITGVEQLGFHDYHVGILNWTNWTQGMHHLKPDGHHTGVECCGVRGTDKLLLIKTDGVRYNVLYPFCVSVRRSKLDTANHREQYKCPLCSAARDHTTHEWSEGGVRVLFRDVTLN